MKNKFLKNISAILLSAAMMGTLLTGCGSAADSAASAVADQAASTADAVAEDAANAVDAAADSAASDLEAAANDAVAQLAATVEDAAAEAADNSLPTEDRNGNAITVPSEVTSIISMAPSITGTLVKLGLADKLVAVDTYSAAQFADKLPADLPQFDMMQPDQEQIVALNPSLVFTSGMSASGGTDVFAAVKEAGVCVADIASSASLKAMEEDIQFIGDCTGKSAEAAKTVAEMQLAIEGISAITKNIPDADRKTVLYEMSTPTADYPTIYTCGKGSYVDEIITLVGGKNVTGDQDMPWVSLTEEEAIALNPDIIITTDNYTPDVVNTLLGLSGWENVTAIKNKDVYYVDANTLNQPNQDIVNAIGDMAQDLYPDLFSDLSALLPAA